MIFYRFRAGEFGTTIAKDKAWTGFEILQARMAVMKSERFIESSGFIHNIDPVIFSTGWIHAWWYGFCFVLGFTTIFFYLKHKRREIGFSTQMVYDLTLMVSIGVLAGGRLIEVCFYEWPFYRDHLYLIPALWLGGMATHGLLIGAVGGVLMFCRKYRVSFFKTTDILVVPAAFILGCGRVGNFIDGNIVGSPADVWWAVEFPDAEGFRHPVVLYDGLKNFLLIPLLLWIGKRRLQAGVLSGIFLFLYAALRIGIDTFREYPTSLLGLATGQFLNLMIAAAGIFLSMRGLGQQMQRMQMGPELRGAPHAEAHAAGLTWRRVALGVLIAFALTIPSDWTADVPERYAKRHPGLSRSALYPRIEIKPNGVLSGSASGGGSAREIVVNNNRTQF